MIRLEVNTVKDILQECNQDGQSFHVAPARLDVVTATGPCVYSHAQVWLQTENKILANGKWNTDQD